MGRLYPYDEANEQRIKYARLRFHDMLLVCYMFINVYITLCPTLIASGPVPGNFATYILKSVSRIF